MRLREAMFMGALGMKHENDMNEWNVKVTLPRIFQKSAVVGLTLIRHILSPRISGT